MNDELIQYIASEKKSGTSDADIAAALRDVGWDESDIKRGFAFIREHGADNPPSVESAGGSDEAAQSEPAEKMYSLGVNGNGNSSEEKKEERAAEPAPQSGGLAAARSRLDNRAQAAQAGARSQASNIPKAEPQRPQSDPRSMHEAVSGKGSGAGKKIFGALLAAIIAAFLGAAAVFVYLEFFAA